MPEMNSAAHAARRNGLRQMMVPADVGRDGRVVGDGRGHVGWAAFRLASESIESDATLPTTVRHVPEQAVTTRPSSTVRLVLRSPLYRRATLSLYFAGLGISIAMPQLSLFLVQDLHASLPVAGLFFLTNLAAPVLGFLVGSWSDRLTDRLLLFRVGAVVGLLGWVLMAFTTQVWMAFAINLTVLGFAGATSSLIFAAVRDQLTHVPTGADNRVMSTVRLGFSLGFMTGPIVGSVVGGMAGSPGHADRGGRLHPAAGGADDRAAGRACRTEPRSSAGGRGRRGSRRRSRVWCRC